MGSPSKRAAELLEHRKLQAGLKTVREDLQRHLQTHEGGAGAAAGRIVQKARDIFERDRHFDPYGWPRPFQGVKRLTELHDLTEQLAGLESRTSDQDDELREADRAHGKLCEELGVRGHREFLIIREIAEAVHGGAEPTPGEPPPDFHAGAHWLQEPKPWDPDYYVMRAIEPLFKGEEMLVGMEAGDILRCVTAVLLALDTDRSFFGKILEAAAVPTAESELAGRSKATHQGDCSPIRQWLIRRRPSQGEASEDPPDWASRGVEWSLDTDVLVLGEAIVCATRGLGGWDTWIPAAMEILEAVPMMVSDLQRQMQPLAFPTGHKHREKLSAVLRGNEPWPGRAQQVVLATTVKKRLVPVKGWQARVAEVLGERPPDPRSGSTSPF